MPSPRCGSLVLLASTLLVVVSGCSTPAKPTAAASRSGDAALLAVYRDRVDQKERCLQQAGYQTKVSMSPEHRLQVAVIGDPNLDPVKDPVAHQQWVDRWQSTSQRCGEEAHVRDAEAAYLASWWAEGSAEREDLWRQFTACLQDKHLDAPARGLTERQISDTLARQTGRDGFQDVTTCKQHSFSLWPSMTMHGDELTTVIVV